MGLWEDPAAVEAQVGHKGAGVRAGKWVERGMYIADDVYFFYKLIFFCIFAPWNMTLFNPNMTLHKLFLNIKKRDVYFS